MPFAFYRRLSARQKAIYRQSDALGEMVLPDPASAADGAHRLEAALASGDARQTTAAARALVTEILGQLDLRPISVRVLSVRPSSATSELHGLYEAEEGSLPRITVWMKTAARAQTVAFKTFVRTLLHEVCHHLDFEHLDLGESFHTKGFFRRESSLVRQVIGTSPPRVRSGGERRDDSSRGRRASRRKTDVEARPADSRATASATKGHRGRARTVEPAGQEQLELPW